LNTSEKRGPAADFRIASTILETHYGDFNFCCFSFGQHEEDQILCLRNETGNTPPLVRVQSACYTAEIFRSKDCDCHEQLHTSLTRIASEGGMLIYMLCDGRGAGLYQKVLGLELGRTHSLDTSDAYRQLGLEQDPRTYERAVIALEHFQMNRVRLLTNNPRKIGFLRQAGIEVIREPLEIPPSAASFPYLETKRTKMGHLLSPMEVGS
jgi:GTP cyclohydrolase II